MIRHYTALMTTLLMERASADADGTTLSQDREVQYVGALDSIYQLLSEEQKSALELVSYETWTYAPDDIVDTPLVVFLSGGPVRCHWRELYKFMQKSVVPGGGHD